MARKTKPPAELDFKQLAAVAGSAVRYSGLSTRGNIHGRVMAIVLTALVCATVSGNAAWVFGFLAFAICVVIWLDRHD